MKENSARNFVRSNEREKSWSRNAKQKTVCFFSSR